MMIDHDHGKEDAADDHRDVATNARDFRVDDHHDADHRGGDRDRPDDDHAVNHHDGVARDHELGTHGDALC